MSLGRDKESEPPMQLHPMEIVGEQNRTIGDQRRLLAKTRMCKTSTLSEIWLVPIFWVFPDLFDQTASRFFPYLTFNDDELKRSLMHPSIALTNMQHSR